MCLWAGSTGEATPVHGPAAPVWMISDFHPVEVQPSTRCSVDQFGASLPLGILSPARAGHPYDSRSRSGKRLRRASSDRTERGAGPGKDEHENPALLCRRVAHAINMGQKDSFIRSQGLQSHKQQPKNTVISAVSTGSSLFILRSTDSPLIQSTPRHFDCRESSLLLPSSLWIWRGKQQIAPNAAYRRCLRWILAGGVFVRSTTTESLA